MKTILSFVLGLMFVLGHAQLDQKNPFSLALSYGYGTTLEHSPDIGHLITGHPHVLMLSYDRKTSENDSWATAFNYPDYGISMSYQEMNNEFLGDIVSAYAHYNFYFLRRHLVLGVGTGIGYATKPYDPDENFRNTAYGSKLLSANYLKLVAEKKNIFKSLGAEAGVQLIHYSNGNFKAPNNSTNSLFFTLGVQYTIGEFEESLKAPKDSISYKRPVDWIIAARGGVHSSDVIGMGQYPFWVFTGMAEKRVSRKSAVQVGGEIFYSDMLKEFIRFRAISFPEDDIQGDEDSRRVGIFAGYRLIVSKISSYFNVGYYAYYPYDFEGRIYLRLGIQYAITDELFTSLSVKSHAAKAEAVELTLGYRLPWQ